ncbi:mariner Mos1 transposase [Trichonephila clavipes]|nr:mariner Mos1 transposase [Trichonephila clavipes]
MIEEELGIGTESVRLILNEDLDKRKLCCRLVLHRLTPEQMEMRPGAWRQNLMNNIVTGDESQCLKNDLESKRQSSWTLLHDNSRPHTTLVVRQFLTANGVVTLDHPSYSSDLAPADFFLFSRLKSALKQKKFTDISDIQSNVTAELKAIPKKRTVLQDLYTRSKQCITIHENEKNVVYVTPFSA